MKQTAVEWFFQELTEVDYGCINKTFLQNNNSLAGYKLRGLFEKAKAMEEQRQLDLIRFMRTSDKMGKSVEDLLEQFKSE